jgi:transcriptional regulator with XRE-family HTH domain
MVDQGENLNSRSAKTFRGFGQVLAERLRQWRKARGLLLKQVASPMGVSVSVLSAWEKGTRIPSLAHLELISSYTGMPVCELLCPDAEACRKDKARPCQRPG